MSDIKISQLSAATTPVSTDILPIVSGGNTVSATIAQVFSAAGAAPLASPTFTGTPTAPTPASSDNSTKVATTAFVNNFTGATVIPSGTKMAFYQASPPVGWTAATIQNDSMMRVVTSGSTGGTSGAGAGHSPILNNVVPSHTHQVIGNTGGQSADHTHAMGVKNDGQYGGGPGTNIITQNASVLSTGGTSNDHSHPINFTSQTNGSAANWQPRYMDFCIGTKS